MTKPRKKARPARVYGRPRLDKDGKLTDEAIEQFAREIVDEMKKAFGPEETAPAASDTGRIDPNKNPDDFEAPPPDEELLSYEELIALGKKEKKRKSEGRPRPTRKPK